MKKNVLIAVLLITTLTSFAFAYIQKIEADRNAVLAEEMRLLAEQSREEAERQKTIAEFNERRAVEARNQAEQLNLQLAQTLLEAQKKAKK